MSTFSILKTTEGYAHREETGLFGLDVCKTPEIVSQRLRGRCASRSKVYRLGLKSLKTMIQGLMSKHSALSHDKNHDREQKRRAGHMLLTESGASTCSLNLLSEASK